MRPAPARLTLDELLAAAEARIARHSASEAHEAMLAGAALVDVRQDVHRERHGIVPGSIHIPLTVLQWRVAPDAVLRNPYVGGLERELILICDHGCSTVLAAASLVELGFTQAGDVIGGFVAWRDAGLPIVPAPPRRADTGQAEGMRGPER
jgi:rhodanese-related sulfurtransferase